MLLYYIQLFYISFAKIVITLCVQIQDESDVAEEYDSDPNSSESEEDSDGSNSSQKKEKKEKKEKKSKSAKTVVSMRL